MSPLEQYQSDKRSGRYHPDTEANWPSKESQSPEEKPLPPQSPPNPPKPDRNDLYIQLLALWCLILTLCVVLLYLREPEPSKPVPAQKKVLKVPNVKKKYIVPRKYKVAMENLATARERISRLVAEQESRPSCRHFNPVLKYKSRAIRLQRLN